MKKITTILIFIISSIITMADNKNEMSVGVGVLQAKEYFGPTDELSYYVLQMNIEANYSHHWNKHIFNTFHFRWTHDDYGGGQCYFGIGAGQNVLNRGKHNLYYSATFGVVDSDLYFTLEEINDWQFSFSVGGGYNYYLTHNIKLGVGYNYYNTKLHGLNLKCGISF